MIEVLKIKNRGILQAEISRLLQEFSFKNIQEVFIKPNLGGREPVIPGENTSSEFMWNLCQSLKEFGVKKIIIGHDSLLNFGRDKCGFEDIVKASNYDRLNQIEGVVLCHTGKVETCEKKAGVITFKIPKMIYDLFYINVAAFKTHMETSVSLTLKNQMGLISSKNRMECHKYGLHDHIAQLSTVLKPNLNMIDGLVAMQGNGPHHGTPLKCDLIMAGNDMVEIDAVATSIMGFDYLKTKHLTLAHDLGVGAYPAAADVAKALEHKVAFKCPQSKKVVGRTFVVWPTTSCSGCIFALNRAKQMAFAGWNFKTLFQFLKLVFIKQTNIVIGTVEGFDFKEMAEKKNLFVFGDCTKKFVAETGPQRFLPGCPPPPEKILEFLTGRCSERLKK